MVFNSKKILLILFVYIKTVGQTSSKVLNYNISQSVWHKFDNEFNKFKYHSNEAKEFEEKYYNNIKKCIINISDKGDVEFIELLNSARVFLHFCYDKDRNVYILKRWKTLKRTCTGHYCNANSESQLENYRQTYIEDESIGFVGDKLIKYITASAGEKAFMLVHTGGFIGWTGLVASAAASPIGLIFFGVGGLLSALSATETMDTLNRKKLIECRFKYQHNADYLDDKCNNIKREYFECGTLELHNSIEEMIDIVTKNIKCFSKIKALEKSINETREMMNQSNKNFEDITNKLEKIHQMIDDIDYDELDEENIIKFEKIKKVLDEMKSRD